MKHLFLTLLIACAGLSGKAQANRPVLSAGSHATLDSITVSYNTLLSDTQQINAIYVQPEVLITLKPNAQPDKIFIEIRNKQSNALLYAVNYARNAAPYSANGRLLFSGQGRKYLLSCPVTLALSSYVYKIYTRDAQGADSSVFTTRQ